MAESLRESSVFVPEPEAATASLQSASPAAMFKNTFQSGFLSILYSIGAPTQHARRSPPDVMTQCGARGRGALRREAVAPLAPCARACVTSRTVAFAYAGSKPLQIWEKEVRNGHIKRITDNDIQSSVLEIMSTNISTTFVSCPADATKTLGIKLPFLVMIIKNVRRAPAAPPNPRPPPPTLLESRFGSLQAAPGRGGPAHRGVVWSW